jgi:hypothetical protein
MFEKTVINKLLTDSTLTGLLSVFEGSPAIFSDEAPECATMPYMVVAIQGTTSEGPVQQFRVDVDFFDYNKSRKNSRIAAQQIEYDLDDNRLTSERYIDLRFMLFSGPTSIQGDDPRDIRVNLQFDVRATRSKWMITTK